MGMPVEGAVNRPVTDFKAALKTAPASRIYFLDNLKILLAVLVILHHAAQPYGPGGGWWIASDAYNILDFVILGIFMAVNASFFMGLFFMISAYFMPSSLERKGAAKFMKDRLVKLGVPILVFLAGVFPIMGYLLNGQPSITLGHLWFLALLMIFSAVYAAYWLVKKPAPKVKRTFPGNSAIVTFAVVMALITFVVAIWSPENNWVPLSLFEPYHLTQYAMLFAAGIIAYREGWIDAIPKATAKLWSRIAVLMVPLLLVVGAVTDSAEFSGGLTLASLLGTTWEAFMCVSMCIALLAFFKNRFNSQSPIAKALADNAFTVYLIHIPIIVLLQFMMVGIAIDPLIKFVIVGVIGVPLVFAISYFVIRRLPYAKYVIG
jgi:peptidoglycan/LPS O-acetylase OafA/YrhL